MQLSSSVGPVFYRFYRFYTEKTCQSTLDWYQCFQSCCDYCWWDWSFVYILIAGCYFKVLQMCIVYCSLQLFCCLIWNVNNWCTSTNLIEVLLETGCQIPDLEVPGNLQVFIPVSPDVLTCKKPLLVCLFPTAGMNLLCQDAKNRPFE